MRKSYPTLEKAIEAARQMVKDDGFDISQERAVTSTNAEKRPGLLFKQNGTSAVGVWFFKEGDQFFISDIMPATDIFS